MHKKRINGGRRISRRTFTTMCQLALVPVVWGTMECCGSFVDNALDFFRSRKRSGNEPFDKWGEVGVTALITMSIIRSKQKRHEQTTADGLIYLEDSVRPNGGIFTPGRGLENYETCLAISCLCEANTDHRYDEIIINAADFVKTCQWDGSKGKVPADKTDGGVGYGHRRRPNLSNTSFFINAITTVRGLSHNSFDDAHNYVQASESREKGAVSFPPDDRNRSIHPNDNSTNDAQSSKHGPAPDSVVDKALMFVSRCQNGGGADGGGFHASSTFGVSPSSCGYETMCGLNALLTAGVARNDARVKSALGWIRRHYDLTNNPGMGQAGLYHYYHVFAKTMHILGTDVIEDSSGVVHRWRDELCTEIVHRQQPDGSWVNTNPCWRENDPHISTAHALLAISWCREPTDKLA